MTDKYIPIGYTKKAHGAGGELKIVIQEAYLEDALLSEALFLEIHGKPAPFFVEYFREGPELLLKLEEVDTPESARELASKDILLRENDIRSKITTATGKLDFEKYTGYRLMDSELGEIGIIEEVQEFPQQEMALISYKGSQIYIPLHEQLIESIDEPEKTITLRLPEGLLDL